MSVKKSPDSYCSVTSILKSGGVFFKSALLPGLPLHPRQAPVSLALGLCASGIAGLILHSVLSIPSNSY